MSVLDAPAQVPEAQHQVSSEPALLRPLLVIAGLGTAAIHFGFAPVHLEANTLHGVFFLTVAWLQLAWALAIARRPTPLVYRLGIVLNAAVIGVWIVSRTVGISGDVEPIAFPDGLAVGLQAFIIIGSFGPLASRLPRTSFRDLTSGAVLGASALAVTALVSVSMVPSVSGHGEGGHAHGANTTEAAGATAADHHGTATPVDATTGTTAAHSDTAGHATAVAVPYDPDLPIDLSGTEGVTKKEQADAENIIANTLIGLPQWADQAVAEAAGFRSIGDGLTGTEHLVNQAFMDDDTILDPDKPESLVYDVKNGVKTLSAAMYMMKTGTPLADVPKTGGSLMQWHTHQNLCYNQQGKVMGITNAKGECRPGLVKPPETPMIHVWIRPHECGPFAALEGIGAGAIAPGETRLCDADHGA